MEKERENDTTWMMNGGNAWNDNSNVCKAINTDFIKSFV